MDITKKVQREVAQQENVQKASKFSKFKQKCEEIFKEAKVGLGIVGLGVMLTFSSCGDTKTTQGPTDTIVETRDAGNVTTDGGNIEDSGGNNTNKYYPENWQQPQDYNGVCDTQPISGVNSDSKMLQLVNAVCNKLDIEGRKEFSLSNNKEYGDTIIVFVDKNGKEHAYSLQGDSFTKESGPLEGICSYAAVINVYGDERALNIPSIGQGLGENNLKIARALCNIGCIGDYTERSFGTSMLYRCNGKGVVIIRGVDIPYDKYEKLKEEYGIEE